MSAHVDLLAGYWTIAGNAFPCYDQPQKEISPFPLAARIEAAAAAGYTGMGLLHADLMAAVQQYGVPTLRQMLTDHGIRHLELEFIINWFAEGPLRVASDRMRRELLDLAGELGARDVKVAPEVNAEDIDMPHMIDAFARLCEDAAAVGTDIALEIMPFSNVNTLERALELVQGAGQSNGGLLLDIWHVARGGIDYEALRALPVQYIKSVELNDAAAQVEGSLWEDTLHRRRCCGEGVLEPKRFIAALQAAGYQGPWAVEILSATHRLLPLQDAAERSWRTTRAQFA